MGHVAVGLDLLGRHSEAVLATTSAEGVLKVERESHAEVPNICVLPRFSGERPRTSWSALRSHWGRYSGLPRDAERQIGLARVPGWVAWLGIDGDVSDPRWKHYFANVKTTEKQHFAAETHVRAIVRTYAESLTCSEAAATASTPRPRLHVVAMPDHFQERAQENLLAAMPFNRDEVRLLWHSVAISLAWIDTLDANEIKSLAGKRVAVIHVGTADVSTTMLELRLLQRNGRDYLVPKRDLPDNGSSFRWHTLPLDFGLAAELLEAAGEAIGHHELWQVMVGGALSAAIARLPEAAHEAAALLETKSDWRTLDLKAFDWGAAVANAAARPAEKWQSQLWDQICASLPAETKLQPFEERQALLETFRNSVRDWLQTRSAPPDVTILTGPRLHVATGRGETLETKLVNALGLSVNQVLVLGRSLVDTAVNAARGCAIYGGRELAGLPTYLDTLPRFCIIGKDRLRWTDVELDLVPGGECIGGVEYCSSAKDVARLRHAALISAGQRKVRFRLSRQGREKQLEQAFAHAPAENCPLSFEVRMRPAQGFARVRIKPENPELFGVRDMYLDWDKMTEATHLEVSPPDFPCCEPFPPNEYRIRTFAAPKIRTYVQGVQASHWQLADTELEDVGKHLQSGSAYGSQPCGAEIDRFLQVLDQHYRHHRSSSVFRRDPDRIKIFIRASAGLFTKTPSWASDLVEQTFLKAESENPDDPNPPPIFLNAAGRCFSTPDQIQLFIRCFISKLRVRLDRWNSNGSAPGMTNWCKAFQIILRLHDEAASQISREDAASLASYFGDLLEAVEPKNQSRLPDTYKQVLFSIYFLLRFRAKPAGISFLNDWDVPRTPAKQIHANLVKNRHVGRRRTAILFGGEPEPTIQESLLRFLESKATAQDLVIMTKQHDQSALEDSAVDT